MRHHYFISIVVWIILASCINNRQDYYKKSYVDFSKVLEIKIASTSKKNLQAFGASFINDSSQFVHFLNDKLGPYYDFRNKISPAQINLRESDYLLSRGREIDSLFFSKALIKELDFCVSKEKTPLFKSYKKDYNDSVLFIYKLDKKNVYRNPCP